MKPKEFWNSRYSEINNYCQMCMMKIIDDLKREISLQEAVTNKLIRADSMSKNPKIIPIKDSYKSLFTENQPKIDSAKEITRKMRTIMKVEN